MPVAAWPSTTTASGRSIQSPSRHVVLLKPVQHWSMTTLREKLLKIGAKVVRHAKPIIFQLAEVGVPRKLFAAILNRIGRLRRAGGSG
ncbi:MAG: transposase [Gemmataceae bacterium]